MIILLLYVGSLTKSGGCWWSMPHQKAWKNRKYNSKHGVEHNNKGSLSGASWQKQSQRINDRSRVHWEVITWESKTWTSYRCRAADEDFGNSWGARTRPCRWLTNLYQWCVGQKKGWRHIVQRENGQTDFLRLRFRSRVQQQQTAAFFMLPYHASIRFRMSRIFTSRFWPSFRSSWRSCSNLLAKNKRQCSARKKGTKYPLYDSRPHGSFVRRWPTVVYFSKFLWEIIFFDGETAVEGDWKH